MVLNSENTLGLTQTDMQYLVREQGLDASDIATQMRLLQRDNLHLKLDRPCTLGDGLHRFDDNERDRLAQSFRAWRQQHAAARFIPASGAASRLFAALDWCRNQNPVPSLAGLQAMAAQNPDAKACLGLLSQLDKLPFEGLLRKALGLGQLPWPSAFEALGLKTIVTAMLEAPGLGLLNLPKALIPFHRHAESLRTALDAQVLETESLVADNRGVCRMHFTVSPEHETLFVEACEKAAQSLASRRHQLDVGFSVQSPTTRTLSLFDGAIVRDADTGQPALRPGGHGSLLKNLESVHAEIVFVKNIDNVAREEALTEAEAWHAALAGLLLEMQEKSHALLRILESGTLAERLKAAEEAIRWLSETLKWPVPKSMAQTSPEKKIAYAFKALHRPLRVCGMVKNEGEPGGGPFFASTGNGPGLSHAPQIVEAAQVNLTDAHQKQILSQASHFNPVDFVCGLRDHRGVAYRLADYADAESWFLARKPKGASWLTVLERPGLWNGAMAHWLTVFVEIPLALFNPVKTIADLLRPAHQGQV